MEAMMMGWGCNCSILMGELGWKSVDTLDEIE